MEYRLVGKTGLQVSCLALGTDNFADPTPEKEAAAILEKSIDMGINLVDTGDVYEFSIIYISINSFKIQITSTNPKTAFITIQHFRTPSVSV